VRIRISVSGHQPVGRGGGRFSLAAHVGTVEAEALDEVVAVEERVVEAGKPLVGQLIERADEQLGAARLELFWIMDEQRGRGTTRPRESSWPRGVRGRRAGRLGRR